MNRIEDERIRFYLEHEARIREWAALENEVREFAHRFYCSLKDDLDAALDSGRIKDGVESFQEKGGRWPHVGYRRHDWPKGNEDPDVRLEWSRRQMSFAQDAHLICGVRANVERFGQPFTEEACPGYERREWWPAYVTVDPPTGRFWEGDNLQQYRDRLVETLIDAWEALAPLVDESIGR